MGQKHKKRAEKHLKDAQKTEMDTIYPEMLMAQAEALLAINHTLRKLAKQEQIVTALFNEPYFPRNRADDDAQSWGRFEPQYAGDHDLGEDLIIPGDKLQ